MRSRFALPTACQKAHPHQYHGYMEARLTYLASPVAGKLQSLYHKDGELVEQNTLLFTLENQPEEADLEAAMANMQAAIANLHNLEKGQRSTVLDSLDAQIKQAKAKLAYAQKTLSRHQALRQKQHISQYHLYFTPCRIYAACYLQ